MQNLAVSAMPLQNHDGVIVKEHSDAHNNMTSSHGANDTLLYPQSAFEDVTTIEHELSVQTPSVSMTAQDTSLTPSPSNTIKATNSATMAENTVPSTAMEVSSLKVKSSKLATNKNIAMALGDSYRIQLYSGVSQKNVDRYWKSLKQKSDGLLASHTPIVHKVDMGAVKGIHYRLQFGEFTKKEAFAFCSRLKEKNIDCWPVKR